MMRTNFVRIVVKRVSVFSAILLHLLINQVIEDGTVPLNECTVPTSSVVYVVVVSNF
jgi:hypothetical protein